MSSFFRSCHPLFRDDLIEVLRACGVDDLELYPVAIADTDNGRVYTHYKAVNILGVIAAADKQKSKSDSPPQWPAVNRCGVRLAENITAITRPTPAIGHYRQCKPDRVRYGRFAAMICFSLSAYYRS